MAGSILIISTVLGTGRDPTASYGVVKAEKGLVALLKRKGESRMDRSWGLIDANYYIYNG